MDGFLRFYKQFPRFILSLLFVFVVFCTLTGRYVFGFGPYKDIWDIINPSVVNTSSGGYTININTGNGFINGFMLFFACVIASTIGTILLHLIVESCKLCVTDLLGLKRRVCHVKECKKAFGEYPKAWKQAILPYEWLAMHFFYLNKRTIYYYLKKKSLAQKEIVNTYKYYYPRYTKDITAYFKELECKLKELFFYAPKLHKFELIRHYDYFSNVSQEQLKRDSLRGDVDNIHYFMVVCFTATLNTIRLSCDNMHKLATCVVFSILVVLAFYSIGLKRWFLASYMLYGFLDVFLIGESASVTDRDSN